MPSLRRVSAIFSTLLLLQLVLLGSGTLCAGQTARASNGAMTMAGIPTMSGAAGSTTSSHGRDACAGDAASGSSAPAPCDQSNAPYDCGMPWVSGQCASTAAVVMDSTRTASFASRIVSATHDAALAEPALLRSAAAAAPELPPPRA